MATTYHTWAQQSTPALRLSYLRLYMGEVQAMLGAPDVSADGKAVDRNALNTLFSNLMKAEQQLLAQGAGATNGGVFYSARG